MCSVAAVGPPGGTAAPQANLDLMGVALPTNLRAVGFQPRTAADATAATVPAEWAFRTRGGSVRGGDQDWSPVTARADGVEDKAAAIGRDTEGEAVE